MGQKCALAAGRGIIRREGGGGQGVPFILNGGGKQGIGVDDFQGAEQPNGGGAGKKRLFPLCKLLRTALNEGV